MAAQGLSTDVDSEQSCCSQSQLERHEGQKVCPASRCVLCLALENQSPHDTLTCRTMAIFCQGPGRMRTSVAAAMTCIS